MFSIRVQRIIQLVSLVILGMVFWNYYKLKNRPVDAVKDSAPKTSFEKALDCRCDQKFVETPEMTVVRILPDEREDSAYQKWIVKAPTGHTVIYAHNLKLCKPLSLKKGERVQISGEFKWTDRGGLIESKTSCQK